MNRLLKLLLIYPHYPVVAEQDRRNPCYEDPEEEPCLLDVNLELSLRTDLNGQDVEMHQKVDKAVVGHGATHQVNLGVRPTLSIMSES